MNRDSSSLSLSGGIKLRLRLRHIMEAVWQLLAPSRFWCFMEEQTGKCPVVFVLFPSILRPTYLKVPSNLRLNYQKILRF